MRSLDPGFVDRVLHTSLLIGAVGFVLLVPQPPAAVSLVAGLGAAWLVWRSSQALGAALTHEGWRARDVARLVSLYFGKYAVMALGLWLLDRARWLEPMAFAAGAIVPTVVVALKAVGWMWLPPELDPVPVYARSRKATRVD